MNPFSRNSSVRRLDACVAQLDRLGQEGDVEDFMALLCREPINVPDSGNIRREKTVGAVVLLPKDGELHLRRGNPAQARTEKYCVAV